MGWLSRDWLGAFWNKTKSTILVALAKPIGAGGQKRFDAAEPLLLEDFERLKQGEQRVPANYRLRIREAGERWVQLCEAWGKPDPAAAWKAKFKMDLPL